MRAGSGELVTLGGITDSVDASLEAPSKGASDVLTRSVGDPAAVTDREVSEEATSSEVAVMTSGKVNVPISSGFKADLEV